MKTQFVKDLAVDAVVDSVFKVIAFEMRPSKRGQPFLSVVLADRTGRMLAKRWDVDKSEIDHGRQLRYVRVQGVVEEYKGSRQIRVDQPFEKFDGDLDPADYEPAAPLKLTELRTRLNRLIDSVQEPPLRRLLQAFFNDPQFRGRFDDAPAAKQMHHACRHGLLQHTVEVAETVKAIADLQKTWGYSAVSADLAVAGALLHDIGKVRELDWEDSSYEFTTTGGLLGHIAIGYQMVFSRIHQVSGFPPALRDSLLHILLAHHGKLEHGSPVTPMLREAQMVNMADDLSVRLFCMAEAVECSADKDFGWHRGIEGGRVYAGSLGLTAGTSEPEEETTAEVDEVCPSAPIIMGNQTPTPPQKTLDLVNPTAAILRTVGQSSRFRRGGRFP